MLLTFRRIPSSTLKADKNGTSTRNCFGYLTSNSASCATVSNSFAMDFFGFFICHFIDDGGGDDIEGGASTSDELVLQCFAIQKPFEVLMLNERFAEKYSLRDGHKVIVESIERVINVRSIEIVPETLNDWNVIEKSTAVIEEIFLNQLRLVRPSMRFVLHLNASLAVCFVVNFVSWRAAFLVTLDTLVLVEPFLLTDEQTKSMSKGFHFDETPVDSELKIERYLLPDSYNGRLLRVLPCFDHVKENQKSLFSRWSALFENINLVVTSNHDAIYPKAYFVEVEASSRRFSVNAPSHSDSISAILLELSSSSLLNQKGNDVTDFFAGLSDRLKNTEMFYRLSAAKHCWISPALSKQLFSHQQESLKNEDDDLANRKEECVLFRIHRIFSRMVEAEKLLINVDSRDVTPRKDRKIEEANISSQLCSSSCYTISTSISNALRRSFTQCILPFVEFPIIISINNCVENLSKFSGTSLREANFAWKLSADLGTFFRNNEIRLTTDIEAAHCRFVYFWPSKAHCLQLILNLIDNNAKRQTSILSYEPLSLRQGASTKATLSTSEVWPITNLALDPTFVSISELEFQRELLDRIHPLLVAKLTCRRLSASICNPSTTPIIDHVVLCGDNSTGKTALFHFLARRLFRNPAFLVFSHLTDCAKWRGQSSDVIVCSLKSTINALLLCQPAVLFLDNFDFVNFDRYGSVDNSEQQSKAMRFMMERIIDELHSTLLSAPKLESGGSGAQLIVVFSVRSLRRAPRELRFWRGRRLFSHCFEIPAIQKAHQLAILQQLTSHNSAMNNQHCDLLAEGTTLQMNYSLGGLRKLAERILVNRMRTRLFTAEKRLNPVESERLSVTEIRQAMSDFDSSELLSVGSGEIEGSSFSIKLNDWENFDCIGGLAEVKKRLTRIFIWPLKYPKLFTSCGIAVGRRAILHGPSGCGKTALIRALAGQLSEAVGDGRRPNIISVRGPELLSKYIGQSEENVRALFERARRAAGTGTPCLLVFDEFDGLAPMRGHDRTGVTDRVVNQLLTELDGVEANSDDDRLFVVAATNRLQLVDRALLRPGRFDHRIWVEPPRTIDERLEVLQCHTVDCQLSDDVDLREWATRCVPLDGVAESWTGAQLRALVVNAKFYALREWEMQRGKASDVLTSEQLASIVVSRRHFDAAFDESAVKRAEYEYTSAHYALGSGGIGTPERKESFKSSEFFGETNAPELPAEPMIVGKRVTQA